MGEGCPRPITLPGLPSLIVPLQSRDRRSNRAVPAGDRRSSVAIGMYWASRISNIGFQMAVPPLAGWWADSRWGTSPWLLIVGAGFGFLSGMLAILKLAASFDRQGSAPRVSGSPANQHDEQD